MRTRMHDVAPNFLLVRPVLAELPGNTQVQELLELIELAERLGA